MKLSNLRIERKEGYSYLICDMNAKFTTVNSIWFSVPTIFEKYLTDDVYDAFMVATITTASGFIPAFLHFISKNFSAPKSAPNPASVMT